MNHKAHKEDTMDARVIVEVFTFTETTNVIKKLKSNTLKADLTSPFVPCGNLATLVVKKSNHKVHKEGTMGTKVIVEVCTRTGTANIINNLKPTTLKTDLTSPCDPCGNFVVLVVKKSNYKVHEVDSEFHKIEIRYLFLFHLKPPFFQNDKNIGYKRLKINTIYIL